MKEKNVKVTTTSGFDDVKIVEYLEPITAHVVVGMNFFKDFLSGFTDFFGGKSNSYQDILSSINEEVIDKLRKKAYSIGANCVVGLKIDNDEISAQGKSMMMVTAMGTAARANFSTKSVDLKTDKKLNSISGDLFTVLDQKARYIDQSKSQSLKINDDFWTFIKKHKVNELSNYIIDYFEKSAIQFQDYQPETSFELKAHLTEYFSSIDYDFAINCLYDKLNSELNLKVRTHITDIVVKSNLIDYNKVLELLENSDFNIQKNAVLICEMQKLNYDSADLISIKKIIDSISTKFSERGERTSKKKMLSTKEVDIWICECEKENNSHDIYCSRCKNDIFGFSEKDVNQNEINDILENKLIILQQILV